MIEEEDPALTSAGAVPVVVRDDLHRSFLGPSAITDGEVQARAATSASRVDPDQIDLGEVARGISRRMIEQPLNERTLSHAKFPRLGNL